ncbi:SRPBCC family protein [Paenibacillus dakarensis]|uniref:SRPBCC family protein n=1 Tax=Paenibacillus dakarensis TaxID=1527293 RepID=UPI0006D540EC|nr:SRPBCC domain-containing protein [Paenibacillus dakarensis]
MPTQNIPEIRKTVVIQAPIEKVWKAVSTAEGLAAWWMESTLEPAAGQEFILHAGQFGDSPCKVTEVEPPHRLGFHWGKDWHLAFELKELDREKTEFTLIHSGWDASKMTEFGQPHAVIREVMNGGWESIINQNLVAYVEG